MTTIRTFDESTMDRIAAMLREWERLPPDAPNRGGRGVSPSAREVRWAKTTTSYYYPTYPTTGNAVVIELGDYDAESGDPKVATANTLTFTPYVNADESHKHVAVLRVGVIPPENSYVRAYREGSVWWIDGVTWMKGKTNASVSAGSSGTCGYYWTTSEIGTVTAYWDWVDGAGGTIASGKEIFLRWYDPGNQWQIVASEC